MKTRDFGERNFCVFCGGKLERLNIGQNIDLVCPNRLKDNYYRHDFFLTNEKAEIIYNFDPITGERISGN